jgi:hypothetical protein
LYVVLRLDPAESEYCLDAVTLAILRFLGSITTNQLRFFVRYMEELFPMQYVKAISYSQ